MQFYANRGYAVLQINFRGSTGFGTDFEYKGRQQWDKRMQQDVIEGVDWIKKQGLVSDDACIAGWSYGGYVALTAAFQNPKLFKCIISIASISNLRRMVEHYHRYEIYSDHIADYDNDEAMDDLDNYSPMHNIDKIVAPMLLVHGRDDYVVRFKQSLDFYKEALDQGKDIKYIQMRLGNHDLSNIGQRKQLYQEIETFLQKHLPVGRS